MSSFTFVNNFIPMLKQYFKKVFNFSCELNSIHELLNSNKLTNEEKAYHSIIQEIGVNDRNSIFIKNFHQFIDSNSSFNDIYIEFIKTYIKPLFPKEDKLVIQKTPNLRISFPNSTAIGKNEKKDPNTNIIGLHCDADFGHHCEEVNFIIPITEMMDTNSIYYEPLENSEIKYEDYENLKLSENEFFMVKFNKLKHFNKINKTNKTRISLDLRIIPYSKYIENELFFKNTKFDWKSNDYYCVL